MGIFITDDYWKSHDTVIGEIIYGKQINVLNNQHINTVDKLMTFLSIKELGLMSDSKDNYLI